MEPTIEEALRQRLPLPWKLSTCDGPTEWKVQRQRPEDFTAEIYNQLKKYGAKESEIRELFYVTSEGWVKLKQQVSARISPSESLPIATLKNRPKISFDEATPAPMDVDLADAFSPELPVSLRDCAAKLMQAIDAMEAAKRDIEFYTKEIRRLT